MSGARIRRWVLPGTVLVVAGAGVGFLAITEVVGDDALSFERPVVPVAATPASPAPRAGPPEQTWESPAPERARSRPAPVRRARARAAAAAPVPAAAGRKKS